MSDLPFGLLRDHTATPPRVEYRPPAQLGPQRLRGYHEVMWGDQECGHHHRRHRGADRCLRRLLGVGVQ